MTMLQEPDLQNKPSANNILDHQALRNVRFTSYFSKFFVKRDNRRLALTTAEKVV